MHLCCLVAKLCLTRHNPMTAYSTPGFSVLQYLQEFAHSCPLSQWCYLTVSSSAALFFCLQSFPTSGSFPESLLFATRGQSIGASASVLTTLNIQGWFSLGLTGLISLKSKGLLRTFSSTIVQRHQFFGAQPSLWSSFYIHTWLMEKPLLLFSHSVVSDSLSPYGLQHARLPCPSLSTRACSNSCPLSQWCHQPSHPLSSPSSCLQSFPASGSFLMSWLFTSGGQNIGASALASVLQWIFRTNFL